MNTIEFNWSSDPGSSDRLAIVIDGVDLIAIAKGAEHASASREGQPGLAGSYTGLPRRLYAHADLEAHFLGRSVEAGRADGTTPVLVCAGCLEAGCWPLVVHIDALHDSIQWSGFSQPHRPEWNHSSMGPFVFSRDQYEEALRRVSGAPL